MGNIATHKHPAWITKADCIIRISLDDHEMLGRSEQLWAREISEHVFELCCIPFFPYGFALGDYVEVDEEYWIQRIVEKKGHRTLRIAVADDNPQSDENHRVLHSWVENTKHDYEFHTSAYLAVDLPPDCKEIEFDEQMAKLELSGDIAVELVE